MADWYWNLERDASAGGAPVSMGSSPKFESRDAAESWIGVSFEELLDRGVDSAALHCGDDAVGQPMSLHPAG